MCALAECPAFAQSSAAPDAINSVTNPAPSVASPVALVSPDLQGDADLVQLIREGNSERDAVVSACHDTHRVDWLTWIGAAGLIATGVAMAVNSFTTPVAPIGMPFSPGTRTSIQYFIQGLGPGLVLGGIGFPFARGLIKDQDPLERACDRVEHATQPRRARALDVDIAAHLMRDLGPPASRVTIALLAIATALTGAGVVIAFTLEAAHPGDYREWVQLSGGVFAGVVTGWFLIPPTPERRAAARFTRGGYGNAPLTARITPLAPAPSSIGVGVVGTF